MGFFADIFTVNTANTANTADDTAIETYKEHKLQPCMFNGGALDLSPEALDALVTEFAQEQMRLEWNRDFNQTRGEDYTARADKLQREADALQRAAGLSADASRAAEAAGATITAEEIGKHALFLAEWADDLEGDAWFARDEGRYLMDDAESHLEQYSWSAL